MSRTRNSTPVAAWGLELTPRSAELVRAERNGTGARIVRRQSFATTSETSWQAGTVDPALLAALSQIPPEEPMGICLPDQTMLCRGFSLPHSNRPAMQKMVDAQAEALLSVSDDRLSWSWQDFPDPLNPAMQWVLLCAARRELLERTKSSLPANLSVRALMPRILTVAEDFRTAASASTASQLLIEVSDEAMTLALVAGGRLLR